MRNLTACLLLCLLLTPSTIPAQTPTHLWNQRFGATGYDMAADVVTDGDGNVYVTGAFEGTVSFGGPGLVSAGSFDIFFAKYDANGAHLWSRRYGSTGNDDGRGLVIDGSGNVVMLGGYHGTINVGGSDLTSNGGSSSFLAKYDANGVHLWSRGFTSYLASPCVVTDIATNESGEVAMTGWFGFTDFGGGPIASATPDIVVAKYAADGTHLWSKGVGSDDLDQGFGVAMDASGNVTVTGKFAETIDFGGGPLVASGFSMFMVKYTAAGDHIWSQSFDGNGNAIGTDIALVDSDSPIVGVIGEPDVGNGPVVGVGARELFAKFTSDGNHQWTRAYEGPGRAVVNSAAATSSGGVAVIGDFYGTVDIGGGPLVGMGNSDLGNNDIFIAVYDANGEHLCSRRLGNVENDQGLGVAVDESDNVIAAGGFRVSVDAGGDLLVSAGLVDAIIAKYRCEDPLPVLIQRFDAVARTGAVELRWNVWSDEIVDGYEILRTESSSARTVVVASGAFAADVGGFVDTTVETGRTYDYALALWANGQVIASSPIATVTIPAFEATLGQNYPNPFNPATTIDVTISQPSAIVVEIYDARGVRVAAVNAGVRGAGTHRLEWDGSDETGKRVGSGVYFYRLEGAGTLGSRKMVLLK